MFCRKILLDAISLVSTPAGIKIMRKLYEDGEISEHQINSWITSLAFTKNPSVEVLNEMKVFKTKTSTTINRDHSFKLSAIALADKLTIFTLSCLRKVLTY